jgi:ssDNA-binding Zn-finger/Zn-ribbon topoisomerase 1
MKIKDKTACKDGWGTGITNPRKAPTMKCPKCGAVMREKTGRYGKFLSCSNWPRCNGTRDVNPTDNSTSKTPTKPTRRRAGLKVTLPETMNYALRQNEPRPHQLKIYRQDDEEATTDLNEFLETDQDWMTLADYCLERDLRLGHTQLIKEGKAITRYHRTHSLPEPHKLPHDQYGTINGYPRCSLDRWYEEFMARQKVTESTVGDRVVSASID